MTAATERNAPADGSYDRALPYNLLAEQSVLGGMLLSKDAVAEVIEKGIRAADFYKPTHSAIFTAILALYNADEPTDPVSVATYLLGRDSSQLERIGGVPYLHTLTSTVPTAANAAYYAGDVLEKAVARRLIEAGTRIVQIGYGQGAGAGQSSDQRVDLAQAAIHELTVSHARSNVTFIRDLIDPAMDAIDKAARGIKQNVLPTGYRDLDRLLGGGLHPGNLIIIAGRPSMGKTLASMDVARHVAIRESKQVLYVSLEMTKAELTDRVLCAEASIPGHILKDGKLSDEDWTRIARASGPISDAPLAIDDTPGQTIMHIKSTARRHQQKHGLSIVIVDYLQWVASIGKPESRQIEVAGIARGLKELAKELNIPVIALCQLNRGNEHRQDKRPMLSDLRESGEIEQSADVAILLHRDDYYDKESPRSGEVDFIVAKNRQGATDTITMAAQLHYSRFMDMAIA